jgi:AraC-like DNA-binding protein
MLQTADFKLHQAKAFYLEFDAGAEFEAVCEQLFILKDNGELSGKNKQHFSRAQSSIVCKLRKNTRSLRHYPAQLHVQSRPQAYNGWLFGLRLHKHIPDLSQRLSANEHRSIIDACEHAAHSRDVKQLLTCLQHFASVICATLDDNEKNANTVVTSRCERTQRRRSIRNTGLSLKKIADVQRDANAMQSLIRSNDTIGGIAMDHGYSDQAHFSRRFQRFSGSSPARFRKRWHHDEVVQIIQESPALPGLTFGMLIN